MPDTVLQKPGPLTAEEWTALRQHTTIGEGLVASVPELSGAAGAVRNHHERWDGTGYPDGLAGEDIPLEARIVAAADAYTAMLGSRAYREGLTHGEALEELRRPPAASSTRASSTRSRSRWREARAAAGGARRVRRRRCRAGAASRRSGNRLACGCDRAEAARLQRRPARLAGAAARGRPAPGRPAAGGGRRPSAGGWTAWPLLEGAYEPRWDAILDVADELHRGLAGLSRAPFLDARDDVWAIADRAAWGEADAGAAAVLPEVGRLLEARRPLHLRSQIVHGDLSGNVLFAAGLPRRSSTSRPTGVRPPTRAP